MRFVDAVEREQVWKALIEPSGLELNRKFLAGDWSDMLGVLFTWNDFKSHCACGYFEDLDGLGNWATKTKHDQTVITPSNVNNGTQTPPQWATHVLWHNR